MPVLDKNLLMVEPATSATSSSWSAERSSLVADVLRPGDRSPQGLLRTVRIRVHGESMLPALWPGDVVEIGNCSLEDTRPGQIILALRDGRLFLHRLIAPCTPNGFLLRGDSVPGSDALFPPEALLGRLLRRTDETGVISGPARGLHPGLSARLSRLAGMLLCHCGIARRLALKLHSRMRANTRAPRNSQNTAELGTW